MGWLIAIGVLAAVSMALLNPHGRKVLLVMFVIGGGIVLLLVWVSNR